MSMSNLPIPFPEPAGEPAGELAVKEPGPAVIRIRSRNRVCEQRATNIDECCTTWGNSLGRTWEDKGDAP
jgi:hypothetical protein